MNNDYINTGRKQQKLKTRNKILQSTQKFLAKGTNFTLEEVAEDAKISRATVYRYYSNIEILSAEAGLDLNTKKPKAIYDKLKNLEVNEIVLGIQDYYNKLAINNETAFRKYLSVVLNSTPQERTRGARRVKTLQLALNDKSVHLKENEIENFTNIATLLMGIEALIVTKDVCHLNNQQSVAVLQWGLKMLLKGVITNPEN